MLGNADEDDNGSCQAVDNTRSHFPATASLGKKKKKREKNFFFSFFFLRLLYLWGAMRGKKKVKRKDSDER